MYNFFFYLYIFSMQIMMQYKYYVQNAVINYTVLVISVINTSHRFPYVFTLQNIIFNKNKYILKVMKTF